MLPTHNLQEQLESYLIVNVRTNCKDPFLSNKSLEFVNIRIQLNGN